jgi:hypothetical protein
MIITSSDLVSQCIYQDLKTFQEICRKYVPFRWLIILLQRKNYKVEVSGSNMWYGCICLFTYSYAVLVHYCANVELS